MIFNCRDNCGVVSEVQDRAGAGSIAGNSKDDIRTDKDNGNRSFYDALNHYMKRCIEIAEMTPNSIYPPYVGAIVVQKGGRIVGEGHKKYIPSLENMIVHAERVAIDAADDEAKGGLLVTTLEPCVRMHNKQILKSCSDYIIERGIAAVVYGIDDFNLKRYSVGNQTGREYLAKKGIKVFQYSIFADMIEEQIASKYINRKFNGRCLDTNGLRNDVTNDLYVM